MTARIAAGLWLATSVGLSFADPSSNAPLVQIATNTSLDFRFIDHYVAPGKLSLGRETRFPNLPRLDTTSHGTHYYDCRSFGLEATVYFYSNMVLVRVKIPGRHRAELSSELTWRYGAPSKTADSASSWDIQVEGERRHITLHKNAVLEWEINGKKLPPPDEALLDVARMKTEEDRKQSAEPDDVEVIIVPQQSAAPLPPAPRTGPSEGAR